MSHLRCGGHSAFSLRPALGSNPATSVYMYKLSATPRPVVSRSLTPPALDSYKYSHAIASHSFPLKHNGFGALSPGTKLHSAQRDCPNALDRQHEGGRSVTHMQQVHKNTRPKHHRTCRVSPSGRAHLCAKISFSLRRYSYRDSQPLGCDISGDATICIREASALALASNAAPIYG